MKLNLAWMAGLLCAIALTSAFPLGPQTIRPRVSFHWRSAIPQPVLGYAGAEEFTVIAKPDGYFLEGCSGRRTLSTGEYLRLLQRAERDGLWHHHHPDGFPHYSCLAWPLRQELQLASADRPHESIRFRERAARVDFLEVSQPYSPSRDRSNGHLTGFRQQGGIGLKHVYRWKR